MKMEPVTVVQVDFNVPARVEGENEIHRAFCAELDATELQVGDIVLAVTEVPGDGFVGRVHEAPVARGKRMDPHTGRPTQVFRLMVTPVDLSALGTIEP